MNKLLLTLLLLSATLQSCTVKSIPLKGKYQEGSVKSKINSPFEDAWESVIDLIAETGISVKLIDKNSGLIIADAVSFRGLITTEDNKGKIIDPTAYVVRERTNNEFDYKAGYLDATAQWNLRVKKESDASSIISVNLHSLKIEKTEVGLVGKSTGNFEKWIIDEIVGGVK
jgi:hypothetical protein